MTKRDFISVFIKIAGMIFICNTIVAITVRFPPSTSDINPLAIYILFLIIEILLIMAADKIALKIVSTDKELKFNNVNIAPKDVFIIIMRIVWMFSIITAVEYFIKIFLAVARFKTGWVIANLMTIIIGIYFLFGAKHLAGFMFDRKPKQAGNKQIPAKIKRSILPP